MKRSILIATLPALFAWAMQPSPASGMNLQSMSFDPPCVFEEGIPLQYSSYLNPVSNTTFVQGSGVILHECADFNVTGYSPPNFMAWNCLASNADGTIPQLPASWWFTFPVTNVSVRVASDSSVGKMAVLVALGPTFNFLSASTVVLTNEFQTLSTTFPGTSSVMLFGPCVMLADDISAQ